MTSINDAQDKLLRAGIDQYLDAAFALRSFQNEIQRRTRAVLDKERDGLASAMGVKVHDDAISHYAGPDIASEENNGVWAWVAIKVELAEPVWGAYFGIYFERQAAEPPMAWTSAMMEFARRPLADGAYNKLLESDSQLNRWKNEVSLRREITSQTLTNFDDDLRTVIRNWQGFWKSVGGLHGLAKS